MLVYKIPGKEDTNYKVNDLSDYLWDYQSGKLKGHIGQTSTSDAKLIYAQIIEQIV